MCAKSLIPVLSVVLVLTGCSALSLSHNSAGVRFAGKQTYCGTSSQAAEVHYFSSEADFENWVSYRDIGNWRESVPNKGLVVVEMGQRPTGGYRMRLNDERTRIKKGVLIIGITWEAPRLDAAVSQALISPCVALKLPEGDYNKVRVVDQLGNLRGQVSL